MSQRNNPPRRALTNIDPTYRTDDERHSVKKSAPISQGSVSTKTDALVTLPLKADSHLLLAELIRSGGTGRSGSCSGNGPPRGNPAIVPGSVCNDILTKRPAGS